MNIARSNGNRSPDRHGIAGIDDEIDQCSLKLGRIDHNRPETFIQIDAQLHRTAKTGVQNFPYRMNAVPQIDALRMTLCLRAKLSSWRVKEAPRCVAVSMA